MKDVLIGKGSVSIAKCASATFIGKIQELPVALLDEQVTGPYPNLPFPSLSHYHILSYSDRDQTQS